MNYSIFELLANFIMNSSNFTATPFEVKLSNVAC